jgi:hypothetical protein
VYRGSSLPSGGLHVDVGRRHVRYWTRTPSTIRHWAPHWWPGWTFESMDDRFEEHAALTSARFVIDHSLAPAMRA